MSSIIDALKKSDHNRSNENGAQINQIQFGQEPPPKSRRGFWLLVILLLLVAFGAFSWTQGWHHVAIAKTKNMLGLDPSKSIFAPKIQGESETPDSETDPRIVDHATKPLSRENKKLTPPQIDEVKEKSIATTEAKKATENQRKQQLEVIAARESNAGNIQSKDDQKNTNEIKQIKNTDDSATMDDADKMTEKTELLTKKRRHALEPALKQDYLLIHQIDFEIRKNIPPIKLNIHIFDPVPENRMVVLNGVKYTTGDNIEEIVEVEEINREGVVLKFENIKFLVPK